MKKPNYSDIFCQDYKGYMEPILLTGLNHIAEKRKTTRSKLLREISIIFLIENDFPLKVMSNKFNDFNKGMTLYH